MSPLGKAVKWLIVPAVCGAIGYYLIGPRVKDKLPESVRAKVTEAASSTGLTTSRAPQIAPDEGGPKPTFNAPEIDVTVTKLGSPNDRPKRKKRRRKKPTTEAPATASPSAPPPDSGTPPPPASPGI